MAKIVTNAQGRVGKKFWCHYFIWLITYLNLYYLSLIINYLSPICIVCLTVCTVCPNIYSVYPPIYKSRRFYYKGDEIVVKFSFKIRYLADKKLPLFVTFTVGWVGYEQSANLSLLTLSQLRGVGRSWSKLAQVHYTFCFLRLP